MSKQFNTFNEFYPFYISEHANAISRRLHFLGSNIALVLFVLAIFYQRVDFFLLAFVQGYACAWIGHFFFEHNKPATFKYPLWSFMGDWRMWWEILTRQRAL